MSIPRPPPSSACTSDSSTTTVRAWLCDVTASRNLKAASLRTILPSHSTIARSPMLSIFSFNMTSSSSWSYETIGEHEPYHTCLLCELGRWSSRIRGNSAEEPSKSALRAILYLRSFGKEKGTATRLVHELGESSSRESRTHNHQYQGGRQSKQSSSGLEAKSEKNYLGL